jgi:hypothetical protein
VLLALGLYATASAVASASSVATTDNEQVCPGDKIDVPGNKTSVTVTAPAGMVIVGYCVKAGSANQGDGPVTVMLPEPVTTVTITYPGGKDISHYTVFFDKAPKPTPSPTPTPTEKPTPTPTPTEKPTPTPTPTEKPTPTPTPTEPTPTPTAPTPAPTEKPGPVAPPSQPTPPSELASTG